MGRRFESLLRPLRRAFPRLPATASAALRVALGVALAAAAAADTPTIYKWVDANGIAHYTTERDQIPSRLRNRIPKTASNADSSGGFESDWLLQDADPTPALGTQLPSVGAGPETISIDVDAPFREDGGMPATASARPLPDVSAELLSVETRIAQLESAIAADQESLKGFITNPPQDGSALADRPEFRVIAERLPDLQQDLAELRSQRARLETP